MKKTHKFQMNVSDTLYKMKWPLFIRRLIERLEESYWVGSESELKELKKNLEDLPEKERFKLVIFTFKPAHCNIIKTYTVN